MCVPGAIRGRLGAEARVGIIYWAIISQKKVTKSLILQIDFVCEIIDFQSKNIGFRTKINDILEKVNDFVLKINDVLKKIVDVLKKTLIF